MIPIADKFLINEGIFSWAKTSISNLLGKRAFNKPVKTQLTANDKIENSEKLQKRLTPKPIRPEPVKLGFKGIHVYKQPANLP